VKGITSIFQHKKWVFAYVTLIILYDLLVNNHIDGAQFMMGLIALIPVTIGASSFDKSKWRDNEQNNIN